MSHPELAPPPLAQQPRHLSPDAAVLQSGTVSASTLNDLVHNQPPDLRSDSSEILFSPHTGTRLPDRSYGSLRLERDGRSKYVGPTANSAWIRDVSLVPARADGQQEIDELVSPPVSRTTSPEPGATAGSPRHQFPSPIFPFCGTHAPVDKDAILSRLPVASEAETIVNAYYRYFGFQYDLLGTS